MIIFKICYGKQTLALVRKDAKLAPIPATLNFNSHMSVIAPKEKDDIEVQFDHSQVYLYEHDVNKLPLKRPRHCLPYAVITWLKTEDEWPASFTDLEVIPQNGEQNGHQEEKNETEEIKVENEVKTEQVEAQPETEVKEAEVEKKEEETVEKQEEVKTESETQEQSAVSPSKQEPPPNPVTPNSTAPQSATPNSIPAAATTPNGTPTAAKSVSYYPKPSAYTAYRQAVPTALGSYLYQPSPFGAGIRLPFGAQQIPVQALQNQSYLNPAVQAPLQQQVFLCRGPNGLTYVTAAAPSVVQQQLAVAQAQAQAQAYLQQQVLQAQVQQQVVAAGLPIKFPNQIIQAAAQPQPQQTQQIIYQAAPQPAGQKPQQPQPQTQPSQQQHVPPPQSPKQQQINAQINNNQALLAAYGAQQQLYAPSPSAQAAIATQQGYMLAGANIQNQQHQLQQHQLQQQQLQQLQLQQQQLLNYQLAGGAVSFQTQQGAAQAGLTAVPAGYQLVDYRQLQAGAVPLDQLALAGVQRTRLLQARHHPYQRQ